MPATTPNPRKESSRRDYTPPVFVDITLTEAQKADLLLFRESVTGDAIVGWIGKRVDAGHILSVKPQEYGYLATLTGQGSQSGHDNQCLTARASTGENAVVALMYRDTVILDHKPWPGKKADFDI